MPQNITTQAGATLVTQGGVAISTEASAVLQGSTHTLAASNIKDANGKLVPLPKGSMPVFKVDNPLAATFGRQNPDGSQPVTFSKTYLGPATFTGSVKLPNGSIFVLTPTSVSVIAA